MANLIIMFTFIGLLVSVLTGAAGMYIAGEKGQSTKKGFILGFFGSIIGIIIISFAPQSNENLTNEMLERKLITKEEYEKTMEIIIKRK